jgi:RNA polymerase sigma factor (sigma-70 family)
VDDGTGDLPTTSDRYAEALQTATRLARSIYSGWSEDRRDDLVQNVVGRLFDRFGREGWPEHLEAYLRQAIRNTAVNMAEHDARRPAEAAGLGESLEAAGQAVDAVLNEIRLTPSVLAGRHIAIDRALGLLDEREADLFRMKFLDNLSTGRIAEELGLHPDTVSRQAHAAKRHLAEELGRRPDILQELTINIVR